MENETPRHPFVRAIVRALLSSVVRPSSVPSRHLLLGNASFRKNDRTVIFLRSDGPDGIHSEPKPLGASDDSNCNDNVNGVT